MLIQGFPVPAAKKAETVLGFHSSSKCVMKFFCGALLLPDASGYSEMVLQESLRALPHWGGTLIVWCWGKNEGIKSCKKKRALGAWQEGIRWAQWHDEIMTLKNFFSLNNNGEFNIHVYLKIIQNKFPKINVICKYRHLFSSFWYFRLSITAFCGVCSTLIPFCAL